MNIRRLLSVFEDWRSASRDLVLATVVETAGSTYSKIGARMLITADGQFQGMLSGGCLEGDLAERAAAVSRSGVADTVAYDLRDDDEALWGLGVGCDGMMRIFLQPLTSRNEYQPFKALADVYAGDERAAAVTVLDAPRGESAAGATLVVTADGRSQAFGIDDALRPELEARAARVLGTRRSARERVELDGHALQCLIAVLRPPPRVLLLGGGLDAEPVVRLIAELGWRVVVQDHRPAYIENGDFGAAESVLNLRVGELGDTVDPTRFEAAIVMSHHLETDRRYLEWLSGSRIPYVGLLGPPERKRRLLSQLGAHAGSLTERLHGPAGIDIGGRGPASIALSIVAEMHRVLQKDGDAPPN